FPQQPARPDSEASPPGPGAAPGVSSDASVEVVSAGKIRRAEEMNPASLPASFDEQAAEPVSRFFTAEEMATLHCLADAIVPRTRTPGALDAAAPEFLEFYISISIPERQALYRQGLERLNSAARERHGKSFAELDPAAIGKLLAPLSEPWTPAPPANPLGAFLRAAKADLLRATVNSRAFADAAPRRSPAQTYWYPVME
ncbi:MAG TPA: gluconate 2-dehydrogenase subunit 3 family protein, partial [Bryobacterales bacterium]|nr:gluconate 2-dehydrogenase subunit 3 family protein [Bryobacterales bacterium]